jgi:hypothetical protein
MLYIILVLNKQKFILKGGNCTRGVHLCMDNQKPKIPYGSPSKKP